MKHFAVVGSPVSHSRSPEIYARLFEKHGIDADFIRMKVEPFELPQIRELTSELSGFAVTMPLKRGIITFLDSLSPEAHACGAVNIVERRGEELIGHNTDGDGLVDALREEGVDPFGLRAVILGRGGAALSAAHALERNGCETILLVRSPSHDPVFPELPFIPGLLPKADIFINAAPLGMEGAADFWELSFLDEIAPTTVFDMVYRNDCPTKLFSEAERRGMTAIDGSRMLYRQALRAFAIWFGIEA